MKYYDDSTN
jgi:hypothetical protein